MPVRTPRSSRPSRLTEVEVTYSRPSARDRKVFSDLVPFVPIVARCQTSARPSRPTDPGRLEVPAGPIPVQMPRHGVGLNTSTDLWGTDDYNAEQDPLPA